MLNASMETTLPIRLLKRICFLGNRMPKLEVNALQII